MMMTKKMMMNMMLVLDDDDDDDHDDDDDDNEVKSTVLRQDFFPWQCCINSLAICSMLDLEAAISTVFATFGTNSTVIYTYIYMCIYI